MRLRYTTCCQLSVCCAVVLATIVSAAANADELDSDVNLSRQKRSPAGHGGYGGHGGGYHEQHYHKPSKKCYQCAYSPPKTVYERHQSYGHGGHGGHGEHGGYGHQSYGHHPATVHGGWDKCLGPFDHYQAKAYGIDTWDCHYNNCYVRRDHNGDIFRGCYKGEYGVDQHLYGCHYQGGSTYCFCEGELCNNGPAPH